jgi:cysteine desulfurase
VAGFGAAAEEVPKRLAGMASQVAHRDRIRASLQRLGAALIGAAGGLPNTICARFSGISGELVVSALDLAGVAISTGAACSSGVQEPSPGLMAMGLSPAQALEVIRISLGPSTSDREVEELLERLPPILERLRRFSAP